MFKKLIFLTFFTSQATPKDGIKQKVISAKRLGVRTVILPADNRKDLDDLTDLIKAVVDIH